jgi:hypothetical protein
MNSDFRFEITVDFFTLANSIQLYHDKILDLLKTNFIKQIKNAF